MIHAEAYLTKLRHENSAQTYNQRLCVLREMHRVLMDDARCKINPWEDFRLRPDAPRQRRLPLPAEGMGRGNADGRDASMRRTSTRSLPRGAATNEFLTKLTAARKAKWRTVRESTIRFEATFYRNALTKDTKHSRNFTKKQHGSRPCDNRHSEWRFGTAEPRNGDHLKFHAPQLQEFLVQYWRSHPRGRDHLDARGCPRVCGEKRFPPHSF